MTIAVDMGRKATKTKKTKVLQNEHSAILLTSIKLPVVIKTFVSSIFEWPFYTGFTVDSKFLFC